MESKEAEISAKSGTSQMNIVGLVGFEPTTIRL